MRRDRRCRSQRRKYHAGEAGVGTGAWLFGGQILLLLLVDLSLYRAQGYGFGFGGTDAFQTAAAQVAFRFLFFDVPLATLVFLSWPVGESYARERWGDRLASFDALLRRDPFNATVGGSLLTGLLASPAVASATLIPFLPSIAFGQAVPVLGDLSTLVLSSEAGPATAILVALATSIPVAVVAILFALSAFHRRRFLLLGLVASAVVGPVLAIGPAPVGPEVLRLLLGFGAPLAAAGIFLASDLLAAAVSLFGATLLLAFLPLLRAFEGPALGGTAAALLVPLLALLALAIVMEVLNETVRKTAPKRMLMTFFFGVLDPPTGLLRYCSAGHLDPYVVRAGGGVVEPLSAWGFPLGVKRREPFVEHVAQLRPGDRLVLCSDGLIEALGDDGEPFGFTRFEDVLRAAARDGAGEIRHSLLAAVKRFTRNRPPEDDQTLVVLSLGAGPAAGEAAA